MIIRLGVVSSNSEQHFVNADQFLPERWLRGCPESEGAASHPFASLPFGHGPRACVGQRFAKLELYVICMKLVQKYKISYHGPQIGVHYLGIGSPDKPLNLIFTKR
eukprot:TRINITY_DN79597_c0_g1_i1.p1 TRINITY_DN79597_c0_g1~~TRINITY_DN79597_c0_g1_i1.p1  ORF type:complete len:106 (+),score=12.87 TRINITY_DN79597_c0_g1_i1:85-402(+)